MNSSLSVDSCFAASLSSALAKHKLITATTTRVFDGIWVFPQQGAPVVIIDFWMGFSHKPSSELVVPPWRAGKPPVPHFTSPWSFMVWGLERQSPFESLGLFWNGGWIDVWILTILCLCHTSPKYSNMASWKVSYFLQISSLVLVKKWLKSEISQPCLITTVSPVYSIVSLCFMVKSYVQWIIPIIKIPYLPIMILCT